MKPVLSPTIGLDHLLAAVFVGLGAVVLLAAVPVVVMGNDCSEGRALVCLYFVALIVTAPVAAAVLGLVAYLVSRQDPPGVLGPLARMLIAGACSVVPVVTFAMWLIGAHGARDIGLPVFLLLACFEGVVLGGVFAPVQRQITRWRQRVQARRAS